ncbi:MAG: putative sulfate exporter family transporter [Flavitalea sp.]
METLENQQVISIEKKSWIHEDWVVVIIGFLIIGIILFGFILPVPTFSWSNSEQLISKVFSSSNLGIIGLQFLFILAATLVGSWMLRKRIQSSIIVFPFVYLLTMVALVITGNETIKGLNLEAVIFSLALGLLIGNFFKLPEWFRAALSTELFVKIGLVLLGTGVIFSDILKAGSLGLIQALLQPDMP